LPETDGHGILENNRYIWRWMVTELEATLKRLNPNLEVAYDHMNLSGVSFGAGLGLEMAFCKIASHPNNPPNLRIRTIHARSPLTQFYNRKPGNYMGCSVSQEEADKASQDIMYLKTSGYIMVPQAGINPSERMWPAHCTSVSNVPGATWRDFWKTDSVYEFVKRDGISPSRGIVIRIDQGKQDVNVDHVESERLARMLEAKFPDANIQYDLEPDQGHAEDYDAPFSKYEPLFQHY
jgi:hypothetical protein